MIIQWSTSRMCFSSWDSTGCFSWTFKGTSLAQILQISDLPSSRFAYTRRSSLENYRALRLLHPIPSWWLIPLSKWVITPVINGIITHLLSGMSHQVCSLPNIFGPVPYFSGTAGGIKHQDAGAGKRGRACHWSAAFSSAPWKRKNRRTGDDLLEEVPGLVNVYSLLLKPWPFNSSWFTH